MESYKKKKLTLQQILKRIMERNKDLEHQEIYSWFDEQMIETAILKFERRAQMREDGKQWAPSEQKEEGSEE